jgi:hypothetical protein
MLLECAKFKQKTSLLGIFIRLKYKNTRGRAGSLLRLKGTEASKYNTLEGSHRIILAEWLTVPTFLCPPLPPAFSNCGSA